MNRSEFGDFRRKAARRAIAAAIAAALPLAAFAGKAPDSSSPAPATPPWLFSVAAKLHMQAVKGDRQAARDSRRMLEDLAAAGPADREVLSYLGSSYLFAANASLTPWMKWAYARKGLSLLDAAVESEPANPRMRFLRGLSTADLPGWLGRSSQSAADISAVAEGARRNFMAGKLPADMAAWALYIEGQALRTRGDLEGAKLMWKDAAALGVENEHARQCAVELARLEIERIEERVPARGGSRPVPGTGGTAGP